MFVYFSRRRCLASVEQVEALSFYGCRSIAHLRTNDQYSDSMNDSASDTEAQHRSCALKEDSSPNPVPHKITVPQCFAAPLKQQNESPWYHKFFIFEVTL